MAVLKYKEAGTWKSVNTIYTAPNSTASSVDGVAPDNSGNIGLTAVRGVPQTLTSAQQRIARENIKAMTGLIFSNVLIPAGSWVADTSLSGYAYKADISLSGVTANHKAIIAFEPSDALSGNLAPGGDCGDGKITIYAIIAPIETLQISFIVAFSA